VRYEALNALLLNAFLKEQMRGEEQAQKVQEPASKYRALGGATGSSDGARLDAKGL